MNKTLPLLTCVGILVSLLLPAPTLSQCAGNCNGDESVTVDEVLTMVNLALTDMGVTSCDAGDSNHDQHITVDEILTAVNNALNDCGTPTPTPSATLTSTPTSTPTSTNPLIVQGTCHRPGSQGLVPCDAGTRVTVSRCQDLKNCLRDSAARQRLGDGPCGPTGDFSITVDAGEAQNEDLYLDAPISGAVVYRAVEIVDFGFIGTGAAERLAVGGAVQADSGSAQTVVNVVIDPSSEGAIRALDAAGLENIASDDVHDLPIQTRADLRADYTDLAADAAADKGTQIAFDLFSFSPQAVTVSPDGQFAYAISALDNTLVVYRRDPQNGALRFLQALRDGTDGVVGLRGASAVVAYGAQVYVASGVVKSYSAVVVFTRDPQSGRLSFVELKRIPSEFELVSAFQPATASLTVSSNGKQVYFGVGEVVVVYERQSETGQLTFVEALRLTALNAFHRIGNIGSVAISPDGQDVYVGSSFGDDRFAGFLTVFRRDEVTGELAFIEVIGNSVLHPLFLSTIPNVAASADGTRVYAATGVGTAQHPRGLAIFARDVQTDHLTFVEEQSGFGLVADIGSDVYLQSLGDGQGQVVLGRPNPETGGLSLGQATSVSGLPISGLAGGIATSSDGTTLYVASSSAEGVAIVERDATTGALTVVGNAKAFVRRSALLGASAVAVSPDGAHVYATASTDNAISVFRRDAQQGALRLIDVQRAGVPSAPRAVILSPNGRHLYVANSGGAQIGVFRRDVQTGLLQLVEQIEHETTDDFIISRSSGVAQMVAVSPDPDGNYVYVSYPLVQLSVFQRDPLTDKLTGVQTIDTRGRGLSVILSPDGAYAYDDRYVFVRDGVTGQLAFVGGSDLVARSAAISPDPNQAGKHMYVATEQSLLVLARDAGSGALSLVESQTIGGIVPVAVTLSPDGQNVYVASGNSMLGRLPGSDALAVFNRNPNSGKLSLLQLERDLINGVDGLGNPAAITVAPDGNQVYVAGFDDDALAIFQRDPQTGGLTFVQAKR